MTPVEPCSPLMPWVGGKRILSKRICAMIDAAPHQRYIEPCVGMGGIFLRRRRQPPFELINDLNEDVVTLFRVALAHGDALCHAIAWMLHSRSDFERAKLTCPAALTDIQRAARFILLQSAGFGGKVHSRTFGVSLTSPQRIDVGRLMPRISDLQKRLRGVLIERMDMVDCLLRYDSPEALFYIDPPYFGTEHYYGPTWSADDFQRLATALKGLRGRWILSINDTPESRTLFGAWTTEEIDVSWSAGGMASKTRAKELIIRSA